MSSTSNVPEKYDATIGQIETAGSIHWNRIERGVWWCLDNGVFTGKFDEAKWAEQQAQLLDHKAKCLFVAIPDVVGDFIGTIQRFHQYRHVVTDYPVALVSQDGIRKYPHLIPWDDISAVFVGGSDNHKLGWEGGWIIKEAHRRGKWVHVGRVNSPSRMLKFWMADSWDGTHLSFEPSQSSKFNAAVLQIRAMKKSRGAYSDLHNSVFDGDYPG
jgi:hypothetical protein